ncbi:MAG: alpha/beta fold hydrolase [Cyanomargarita calcarea GSE-NOS-MK-12-04C]|jgi:hypothetical protein|uniref:Alpha/beta fold hydrolase n=1 Tax=Cyanomargarita calcarea GSE-NOS-MK-12-04C TaxID=2839659 RepID=A0A951QQQ4_9CYAN|nr:alpha/beta fold hydrolase [Cyanomargarita calcarea GSE-NOS-MK-12-04C]
MFIYLHGFASSPNSAKAKYISDRFAEIDVNIQIPDLNFGDFSHLTISRQINQVTSLFSSSPITLIGSSLGGLTAAHIANKYKQVQRLVLLAPAFGFLSHWLSKLGDEQLHRWQEEKYLMVHHYGEKRELPLSYDFVTDALEYQEDLLTRPVSTLILHGLDDEVIPIQASRDFAKSRPWVELVELDSDHALGNTLFAIWQAIQVECQLPTML